VIPRQRGEPRPRADRGIYTGSTWGGTVDHYRFAADVVPEVDDLEAVLERATADTVQQLVRGGGAYYGLGDERQRDPLPAWLRVDAGERLEQGKRAVARHPQRDRFARNTRQQTSRPPILDGTVPESRAYSLLYLKELRTDARTFAGVATTPELDRQGHSVDPAGVTFRNPLPLLFHHDTQKPIGRVTLFPATAEGIAFEATLPDVLEPGALRDRVNEAWHSIKAGLMHGVSIGFRLLDDAVERLPGGGLRLLKTEILELSLVTIPSNASASIRMVKALDLVSVPGVPGRDVQARGRPNMEPIPDQIKSFEASRSSKAARMQAILTGGDAGATLDELQQKEFDGLDGEVKTLDAHLTRLRRLESLHVASATPLPAVVTASQGAELRGGIVSVKPTAPKGSAFIRAACALLEAKGDTYRAQAIAARWKDSTPEVELYLKAAVAPGTTTDPTWAGALVTVNNVKSDFLELLRPATIIGKIPGLLAVPFNSAIPVQTAGGTYGWVGQGAPKPVTKLGFGTQTLGIAKAAGIVVLTEELVRLSNPQAEDVVRRDMIAGIAQFLDQQFVDPAVAAVANVSPASITNGTTAITSTGSVLKDIQALVATFTAANMPLSGVTLIMSETNAFTLGMIRNTDGSPMFAGMGASGGSVQGITVVTSNVVGGNVILVQPRYILYADEGGVNIDVSREASVQMLDTPDNPAVATTVLTSLWQNNLVGLRAERFINWNRAVLAAVKYVSGAAYLPTPTGVLELEGNGGAAAKRAAAARGES
jgi:HK97 family phage major capsid protein/HK97 family phage prohead protease